MHQKSLNDQLSHHENTPTDLRLKHLSDKILPESPYILKVPTTYRVSSHQVNDWRRGSPFAAEEEQLQYLSFNPHIWEDTMLTAVGDWDDGHGGIADKSSQNSSKTNSGLGSPLSGQPPRKKISLEAYKNKTAANASAKQSPAANGENKVQAKVNAPAVAPVKDVKLVKEDQPQGQKRPIEAITHDEAPKVPNHDVAPPPAKKARTSPEPPSSEPNAPPKQATRVRKLPPLLSPTLPPSIEEELARRKKAASVAPKTGNLGTADLNKGQKAQLPPNASHPHVAKNNSKEPSTVPNKPGSIPTSKNRNDPSPTSKSSNPLPSQQKQRVSAPDHGDKNLKPNGITATRPPANGLAAKSKEESNASPAPKAGLDKPERKSLMVKLKIPKSARKNLVRIINMRVLKKQPDPSLAPQMQGPQRNRSSDQHEGKNEPDTLKPGEKRRRIEEKEDESSSKRQKPSSSTLLAQKHNPPIKPAGKSPALPSNLITQKPPTSTPIKPTIRSPALSQHGSAQKPQTSTPMHNLKSTAMHRITSAEGNVQTPSEGIRSGTPTAPGSAERSTRDARATSSTSSTTVAPDKNSDVLMWKTEQKKYSALGRTLKHAADEKLKGPESNDVVIKNQGIALAIETVLCYMLAFLAGDESLGGRKADAGIWRSLLGYLNFVIGHAEPIPHLHGLCRQLEAVCRDTILFSELERLERDPTLATGSDDARPSPPNRETGAATADRTAKAAGYAEFKKEFVKNAQCSHQSWLVGYSRLSTDALSQLYPNTWAKRTKVPGAVKGKERLVVGKYGDGGFYLPLSQTSSGIEAVRMGMSFLEEWCKTEKVQWKAKLTL